MFADAELVQIKQSALKEHSLFVRYEAKHGLHCEVIVYFPPELKNVAKQHLATPCTTPDKQGLTKL